METIDTVNNEELAIDLIEEENATLVVAFQGRVSKPASGGMILPSESAINRCIFQPAQPWQRIVLDLRGLVYINSTGAAMLISLHRAITRKQRQTIVLLEQDSIVTIAFQTIGFFSLCHPLIVWDDYGQAIVY